MDGRALVIARGANGHLLTSLALHSTCNSTAPRSPAAPEPDRPEHPPALAATPR
jgi:hypothetical protein